MVAPGSSSSGHRSTSFLRNAARDHNLQLISLLAQLRDSLAALPSSVASAVNSSSSSSSGGGGGSDGDGEAEKRGKAIEAEITSAVVTPSHAAIDSLVTSSLVAPLVLSASSYVKSVLFHLPSEGAVRASISTDAAPPRRMQTRRCCKAAPQQYQGRSGAAHYGHLLCTLPRARAVGGSGRLTPQKRGAETLPCHGLGYRATVSAHHGVLHQLRGAGAAYQRGMEAADGKLSALEHAMSTSSSLNITSVSTKAMWRLAPSTRVRTFGDSSFARKERSVCLGSVPAGQGDCARSPTERQSV